MRKDIYFGKKMNEGRLLMEEIMQKGKRWLYDARKSL